MNPENAKLPETTAAQSKTATAGPLLFSRAMPWIVLAIGLAGTAGAWHTAKKHSDLEARKKFEEEARRIAATLNERMLIYQDVLHGAVGLFSASVSVERSEWRAYLKSVSIEKRFPGVDGVGFVACVKRDSLDEFVSATRADNAPDFQVKGAGTNADLFIIKYLEPEERHRERIGLDTGADPDRRAVAELARDTGDTAISAQMPMTDQNQTRQTGFLMMLPVYRFGAPTGTVAERRANIIGWVYARFVTPALMKEVLGNTARPMRVIILDGPNPESASVIFDDDPGFPAKHPNYKPRFTTAIPMELGGRTWTLRFASKPAFDAAISHGRPLTVAGGGLLISLLLFGIVLSLATTRERALAIASDMTATLCATNRRLQEEIRYRQRAEQSIKNSEALYHSLVENLPMSIVRKDLDGRITFANQRFCNEVGRSLQEIIGRTDSDLFPPELAARRKQDDRRVIETGVTVEQIEECTDPDRGTTYVQVIRTPVYDGTGNIIGLLGIFWDVTDKHRTQEALQHEKYLLQTLMDNLPDRIYFKDLQSRFLRNSRAHLERFGLKDQSEALGRTDFDFFAEEHARQAYEDEQEVIRTGKSFTKEEKETWPDGSVTWALTTKMPLRDENGRIIGTFGISHDITDRKHAEEAMRRAKEVAEEASQAKSRFLASMSHELRTPLNSIIGFANLLLKNKNGNLDATELNFLERIRANGKHLLGLINEILDLSKIEARKVRLQIGPVALDNLIRETIALQEGLVRDRPVQLLTDIPATVAPIQTDADKLKQVIINLLGNAIKFTEQGTVTVRLLTDPQTNRPVRIDISDTGIGIPKDKLGPIFEAFQQADTTTARKYGGTGLGLTISQALCQLMGHRITVQSEPGKGSTFSVLLASAPEGAPGTDATTPPARNHTSTQTS